MINLLKDSVENLKDFEKELEPFFVFSPIKIDIDNKLFSQEIYSFLMALSDCFTEMTVMTVDDFKLTINNIKSEYNVLGNIWKPMRIAITGKEHGPDISQFITILGPKECSERLKQFLHFNGQ